jgi:hypothetical protein
MEDNKQFIEMTHFEHVDIPHTIESIADSVYHEVKYEEEAKCKQILTALPETRINNRTAYSEGHAAGWQEALLKVQSELAEVALSSRANKNESRPENLVIMLSDIDKVIYKMLEDK